MRGKAYGVLQNVSLRCDRRGTRFVRAQVVAQDRLGHTLFTKEIIAYPQPCIERLLALGNNAQVWVSGEWIDVPRDGGRHSVRMLRAFDVRDSSSYVATQASPA